MLSALDCPILRDDQWARICTFEPALSGAVPCSGNSHRARARHSQNCDIHSGALGAATNDGLGKDGRQSTMSSTAQIDIALDVHLPKTEDIVHAQRKKGLGLGEAVQTKK